MSNNEKIIVALKSAIYLLHRNRVERFQFVGYEPMYGEDAEDVLEDLVKEYERKELTEPNTIKFWLDGCDISFVAEAPGDITLKQMLKQTDRICPDYCACGIKSLADSQKDYDVEIRITYDGVEKVDEDAPCTIREGV